MPYQPLSEYRALIRTNHFADEQMLLDQLIASHGPSQEQRKAIGERAWSVIDRVRKHTKPTMMESFLQEYGLSTEEGLGLMTLAEALLRVPDSETVDRLIEDKIVQAEWGDHFGRSDNALVNASTMALGLTATLLDDPEHAGPLSAVQNAAKRLGTPVVRASVQQAMRVLGGQFVLGETIEEAMKRARKWEKQGATYSYDMLGEAAVTAKDSEVFFDAYMHALDEIAKAATSDDIRDNPGLSIKLSALYPRYEMSQQSRAIPALAERVSILARKAAEANVGLNIDAEEAYRLGLSLDLIELVLADPRLAGWDGFGVVVQAFGKRASFVIDWLYALATQLDRKIMVRLVKGAYWDSEIKLAQMNGVESFPVFTAKSATDISFICCANQLLDKTDRIYPQFATHNAHSVAAIMELAGNRRDFEFQRLHGMGEGLHGFLLKDRDVRSRVYAPVGAHRELLAYLVRRLLENGANNSFVAQLSNPQVPTEDIAADPFETLAADREKSKEKVVPPSDIYLPERLNSRGYDLAVREHLNRYQELRMPYAEKIWRAGPLTADGRNDGQEITVHNPAMPEKFVGYVIEANEETVEHALASAKPWDATPQERAEKLRRIADLYEANEGEFYAVLTREAGKSPVDTVTELREAVDFLRYYASQCETPELAGRKPRGVIACISPWNFPLAIFTGQIAAALAAGNGVIAKPAETTPLVAFMATRLFHLAGVPETAIQLLPGTGAKVGSLLSGDPRIDGVCFTGSVNTAHVINRSMADALSPDALLIAETGGLNSMIVDSSALPEQAVKDVITSAFQSAGQRCSALRMLYVHQDVAEQFIEMLSGAMDELSVADPWYHSTDVGPVIDAKAHESISEYVAKAKAEGRLIKQIDAPEEGHFVGPAVIRVNGINDLEREVFGPVLHLALFGKQEQLQDIINDVNGRGYGLTAGLHTRIKRRQTFISDRIHVGNMYVNRNQIGAVVGTHPFGGEGLSGTGPKAGGPHYLPRFYVDEIANDPVKAGREVSLEELNAALAELPEAPNRKIDETEMPGATGESNCLSLHPRGPILCLGPDGEQAMRQAQELRELGCPTLVVAPGASGEHAIDGFVNRELLAEAAPLKVVVSFSNTEDRRAIRKALAARDGAIVPLFTTPDFASRCLVERHICIDTTAAGGNVSLLS
ncbi:bifunctional proline dehydrogenase/L-glutamate gamma-semialdehyde dehydrogenase PutA [Aurantiacibacter suaedae]|uniref:bifunctional proline dehydrogenase/L-glutamate gamma-semialdehyde dehydrogenase PutA n=1 Tax=Aurantiacibacter suaedae TaxID=2545755 RepID=UPI001F5014D0|nr:bifunctional proline dehydrogenase/L-glutamate gamma-semialdehyde dehydrogenase PutA [Aurantiacibacter suaedae]